MIGARGGIDAALAGICLGSVAYLFHKTGVIGYDTARDPGLAEKVLEAALEASADDVVTEGGWTDVVTRPESFESVRKALEAAGLKPARAEITQRPATLVPVEGAHAEAVLELLEALDELDDVQHVHTNAKLPGGSPAVA